MLCRTQQHKVQAGQESGACVLNEAEAPIERKRRTVALLYWRSKIFKAKVIAIMPADDKIRAR